MNHQEPDCCQCGHLVADHDGFGWDDDPLSCYCTFRACLCRRLTFLPGAERLKEVFGEPLIF